MVRGVEVGPLLHSYPLPPPPPPPPQPRPAPRLTVPEEFPLSRATGKHTKESVAIQVLEERLRAMPFQPQLVASRATAMDLSRDFLDRCVEDQMRREANRRRRMEGEGRWGGVRCDGGCGG